MKSLKDTHSELAYRLKLLTGCALFGAATGLSIACYLFQQRFGEDNFDFLSSVLYAKLASGSISGVILHAHGMSVNDFWSRVQATPQMMDALSFFQNYLLIGGIGGALFCVSICMFFVNKGEH